MGSGYLTVYRDSNRFFVAGKWLQERGCFVAFDGDGRFQGCSAVVSSREDSAAKGALCGQF